MDSNGQIITLEEAAALTRRYRDTNPVPGTIIAERFDANLVRTILDQPGCSDLRIYYGRKEDLSPCLILVGCNSGGNDMTGIIVELGDPCPDTCSGANLMNT